MNGNTDGIRVFEQKARDLRTLPDIYFTFVKSKQYTIKNTAVRKKLLNLKSY